MIKVPKARVAFVPAHDSCVVGRFARRSSSSGCVTDSEANPCRLACIVRRSPNLSQRSTSKHSGRRDERIMVKVPKPKKVSASFSIAQNAHAHSDACGRKEQEEQTKCRLRAKLAGRKKAAREEAANKADDDKENAMPSSGATPSSDADNTCRQHTTSRSTWRNHARASSSCRTKSPRACWTRTRRARRSRSRSTARACEGT